jgi:hypothetical protein
VVSFGLLVLSVAVLFHWADGTRLLFVPLTGIPAILPALFTFWIAGRALSQVAKAGRLPQFFGFQDTPKIFIFIGPSPSAGTPCTPAGSSRAGAWS